MNKEVRKIKNIKTCHSTNFSACRISLRCGDTQWVTNVGAQGEASEIFESLENFLRKLQKLHFFCQFKNFQNSCIKLCALERITKKFGEFFRKF